jgi:quinol monooxygenase YgiN
MSEKLYVTARFSIKESALKEAIMLLEQLSLATRSEKGCLEYCYYQSVENPLIITSIEIWESSEAETAHWSTNHISEALAKLPEFVDGQPEVVKYHKLI